MMSARLVAIEMIDHDALSLMLLRSDQSCTNFLPSFSASRGIVGAESFRLVAVRAGLRCGVDVCGRHWSVDIEFR